MKMLKAVICSFLLLSCSNNQICFDRVRKLVYSCDNYYIKKIIVTDLTDNISYYITPKKRIKDINLKYGFTEFDVISFNKKIDKFKLIKNHLYEIKNISESDAAAGKLKFYINSADEIISTP